MNRELNKIFDAKTREARRRILDKFDISNEDKNEVLNKIEESGSDNGDGDASTIEYLDITNVASYKEILLQHSLQANLNSNEFKIIAPSFAVYASLSQLNDNYNFLYIEIDFSSKIYAMQGTEKIEYPIGEYLVIGGVSQDELDAIPRITKEEFYSLENPE